MTLWSKNVSLKFPMRGISLWLVNLTLFFSFDTELVFPFSPGRWGNFGAEATAGVWSRRALVHILATDAPLTWRFKQGLRQFFIYLKHLSACDTLHQGICDLFSGDESPIARCTLRMWSHCRLVFLSLWTGEWRPNISTLKPNQNVTHRNNCCPYSFHKCHC